MRFKALAVCPLLIVVAQHIKRRVTLMNAYCIEVWGDIGRKPIHSCRSMLLATSINDGFKLAKRQHD